MSQTIGSAVQLFVAHLLVIRDVGESDGVRSAFSLRLEEASDGEGGLILSRIAPPAAQLLALLIAQHPQLGDGQVWLGDRLRQQPLVVAGDASRRLGLEQLCVVAETAPQLVTRFVDAQRIW